MAVLRKLLDSLTDANDGRWKTQLVDSVNYLLTVEDYHVVGAVGEPAFENSWGNVGGTDAKATFYKDPFGVVHIKGRVDTGTLNTDIFTLPAGYIPSESNHFTNMQSNNAVSVRVNTLGKVSIVGAVSNTNQSINCSFRV